MRMSDIYERELKGILSGEKKFIERVSRQLRFEEKIAYSRLSEKRFFVVRAAGSFGIDLIAVRGNFAIPIEVKSSGQSVFRFSRNDKLELQAERMRRLCEESSLIPAYAFRLKNAEGDPWRLFTIDGFSRKAEGVQKLIFRRLPEISRTQDGNRIMKWEEGAKLSGFVDYLTAML